MPAIRDFSSAATTVATGTTLVFSLPDYEQNDLLLAIFMADTGAGVWTSTGWAHVTGSPSVNTSQLVAMWKIAGAAETAPTFTSTVAESYNGVLLAIRDVNTTNPFGSPVVVNFAAQAAAAKFNMQQITTNIANALVIYASANSGVGVPSILEGPVFGLVGQDGLAESLGVGWSFQATAGSTPANVGVSNIATGAGVKLALQIAPPSGGATVIPPYCVADNSVYLNPLHGITAFNGDTAIAATADTGFGTSLGGITAADATVAAAADVGINPYHSAARVTSITGSTNLAGVELVFAVANRPNVTGKNILVHVGPSTEGQLQRFSTVASGRGIWFGMRSGAATNYKIWQCYGRELGILRHQPIVINSAATSTKASAGTLSATSILAMGFWVAGNGQTTTIWDFASLWALDTTVVCGGNAAAPINIAGIVSVCADGKERRSVLKQGSSQMTTYQAIQIGNGTNSTYLLLDSTAIEFPRQYDANTKSVTYNSTDNVVGLTYYASSSDTIVHRNSVISSASRYHWGVHASANTAATYDFSGLSVIGAGTITLKAGIAFNSVTFNACSEFSSAGATLTNCVFSGQTTAEASAITVSSPSDMALITGGSITGNNGATSRGIKITAAGTYTFSGIQFSGNTFDVDNASGGAVVINATNGCNVSTFTNTAGGSTTINNSKTLTLTGIVVGSEVRIFSRDGSGNSLTELAGIETTVGSSFAYNYSYAPATLVNIVVLHNSYQVWSLYGYELASSDSSLPIQQISDRQYSNPA